MVTFSSASLSDSHQVAALAHAREPAVAHHEPAHRRAFEGSDRTKSVCRRLRTDHALHRISTLRTTGMNGPSPSS